MSNTAQLPWKKIHEYLLEVGSSSTKEEMCCRAVQAIGDLIPWDADAGLFTNTGECIVSADMRLYAEYNAYYRKLIPFVKYDQQYVPVVGMDKKLVEWRDFEGSEFVHDFMYAKGIRRTIARFSPQGKVSLSLHRTLAGPTFTEKEGRILHIVNAHLSNYYACFARIGSSFPRPSVEGIRDAFPRLSAREAEVLALLASGLSVPEVALQLLVSTRTAEKHIEHIYAKLAVRTKRQAIDTAIRRSVS